MDELTEDRLLGGRVRLLQPARGFRAGLDSVLLAAAVEARAGMRLLEAGCGGGAALLCVAARADVRLTGVEREPAMAALARENAALNGWAARIAIVQGDGLAAGLDLGEPFDGAFCNPPFDEDGRAPAPRADRAHAYLTEAPLDLWVRRIVDRLTGGAALTMIHRARALPDLLAAFEGRLGGVEVLPLRPRAGEPAKRVLIRARKGSRAALRLYAGADLHVDGPERHSPLIEAVLRGEAELAWR